MDPTAKHCKELQTTRGRTVKRSSLQRSGAQPFRVINRMPCPLSAFYPENSNTHPGNGAIDRGRNSISIRDEVREKEAYARQKLQEMQRHLDRISVSATNGKHTQEIEKEERTAQLVSRLEERNSEKDDIICQLQQKLSNTEKLIESKKKEMKHWKKKHRIVKKKNLELIEKMAAKAIEQKKLSSEAMELEVSDFKIKYDELVQKVGELADENGHLLAKCIQLEENEEKRQDELVTLEEIQEENAILHQSMEEAAQLVQGMNEKMASFVQVHKLTVQRYEEKLGALEGKTNETGYYSEMIQAGYFSEMMNDELAKIPAEVPRMESKRLLAEKTGPVSIEEECEDSSRTFSDVSSEFEESSGSEMMPPEEVLGTENEAMLTEQVGLVTIEEESEDSSQTLSDISAELEESSGSDLSEFDEIFDLSSLYSYMEHPEKPARLATNNEHLSKSLELNNGLLRSLVQQTSYSEEEPP